MRFKSFLIALTALFLLTSLASAQKGEKKGDKVQLQQTTTPALKINHAKTDTLWFEFKQTGNKVMADLFIFNDEPIAGGQIPLSFGNGKSPIDVDSVVFDKNRAARFDVTNASPDTMQSLRIGFIADISGRKPPLEAGKGRLLTIYFNLKTDKPYEVVLDTTTLVGGFSLLFADQAAQTIPVAFKTGKFKTK
jgi:hypothetical protein